MSAGTVHRKASVILSAGFLLGSIYTMDFSGVVRGIGSLIGIVMTPDWDVDSGMIMDKTIRTKIGKWAELLWDWFLYWYRRSLKHGSPLSHVPILSTYGRIAYTFLFIIAIPHAVFYLIFHPAWDLMTVLLWYWEKITSQHNLIAGLCGSDFLHWGLDIMTTEHSKKTKKGVKNKRQKRKRNKR